MRTVAIIGASADRRKFGNKAVRAFVQAGWKVFPVNPHESTIEGIPASASIEDIEEPLDRVSMYVPPDVGLRLLPDIAQKSPGEIFFNPGAESVENLRVARDLGLVPMQACSIVNIGLTPEMFGDK